MMKKLATLILFLCCLKGFSQDASSFDEWSFKTGINIVDNRGTSDLFGGLSQTGQSAFGDLPISLGVEKRLSRLFGIEAIASINSWEASEGVIDGIRIPQTEGYYALDLNAKLYLNQLLNFGEDLDWLKMYATSGVGRFTINKGTFTFNYGGGASVWLSEKVALDFNTTIKNTFGDSEVYETSHFVYSAGLIFRLSKKKQPQKEELNKEISSLMDSDGDGVPDDKDYCKNKSGLPENNGCPYADSDGDGLVDKDDHCPQIKGDPANNGCPAKKEVIKVVEVIEQPVQDLVTIAKKIQFQSGNYNFTQETYPYLNNLAKRLTQEPTSVRFKVIGHTDSTGSYEANRVLSERRASAVRNYLVDSGIEKSRIDIEGLGESDPIDTNLTVEGRANNRRVEIIIIE